MIRKMFFVQPSGLLVVAFVFNRTATYQIVLSQFRNFAAVSKIRGNPKDYSLHSLQSLMVVMTTGMKHPFFCNHVLCPEFKHICILTPHHANYKFFGLCHICFPSCPCSRLLGLWWVVIFYV